VYPLRYNALELTMRSFYQVRLGKANVYAAECHRDGYVGTSWFAGIDLTKAVNNATDWRAFNKEMIPVYLSTSPDTKKVAAGLFCGFTYTVAKSVQTGDVVISPLGEGKYIAGEVSSDYTYVPNTSIPHRRIVKWYSRQLDSTQFTEELKNSMGSIGTVTNLSKYSQELEALLQGESPAVIYSQSAEIEDPSVFALEKHLEDFLIANWASTDLSKEYDIFEVQGELVGQQYPTDTGPIDILAISKDKKTLLVIELKKGRVSDVVVGQTHRYMGYIQEELAEVGQSVKGLIIGLNEDLRLKRALAVAPNIEFYRYQVNFKLIKGFSK
jgi:restriction system protein